MFRGGQCPVPLPSHLLRVCSKGGQCGENPSASGDARSITVRYLACASRGITGITGRPHEGAIRHRTVKVEAVCVTEVFPSTSPCAFAPVFPRGRAPAHKSQGRQGKGSGLDMPVRDVHTKGKVGSGKIIPLDPDSTYPPAACLAQGMRGEMKVEHA